MKFSSFCNFFFWRIETDRKFFNQRELFESVLLVVLFIKKTGSVLENEITKKERNELYFIVLIFLKICKTVTTNQSIIQEVPGVFQFL